MPRFPRGMVALYNQEAVDKAIAGDATALIDAFDWSTTRAGAEYWASAYALGRLDAERDQDVIDKLKGYKRLWDNYK